MKLSDETLQNLLYFGRFINSGEDMCTYYSSCSLTDVFVEQFMQGSILFSQPSSTIFRLEHKIKHHHNVHRVVLKSCADVFSTHSR